jgi:DNA polymerase elongation subunit (family B)
MPNPYNPDDYEAMTTYKPRPILVFDIETGVRADVASNPKAWFKPDGRLKNPDAIAQDLQDKILDTGALSPITGHVLAIGMRRNDSTETRIDYVSIKTTENNVVASFLILAADTIRNGGLVVGFNSHDFDWPFLLFRAKALGVDVPACIGTRYRAGWSMSESCVDLMNIVRFGKHDRTGYSLDRVSRAAGLGGKNGDGNHFAQLMATDIDAALDYLTNDVEQTYRLAEMFL